jgi:formylglycine-generating enzyme required for sulfatase activity/serine/threonine protein kinase
MPFQPNETLLNKYRIEALIGRGAFAEVYRARHLTLNASRALKVLRKDAPGLGSTEYTDFHARFQLEAQLGARIDHPNVIRVHDFEQNGETLILVMEYASGGSLAEKLAQTREQNQLIPIDEAIQIAIEVAQGLSALHALDAVHRDLKPSNILFDQKGQAKVADIGLAQIPGGPSLRSQLSTGIPHPGTPGYMSPEQESISNYLTPASDVYALGLVLFETLTGRVYRSQRPGTRVSDLRGEVPLWLDELIVRMLADHPKERLWDGVEMILGLKTGQKSDIEKQLATRVNQEAETQAHKAQDEKIRLASDRQSRKIDHLKREFLFALSTEKWEQAEKLIIKLNQSGADGRAAVEDLRQELTQMKSTIKNRQRRQVTDQSPKFTELEGDTRAALDMTNGNQGPSLLNHSKQIPRWAWIIGGALLLGCVLALALWGASRLSNIFDGAETLALSTQIVQIHTETLPPPKITETPVPSFTPSPTVLLLPIIDDYGVPMVLVPGGEFRMGERNASWWPAHTVMVDDFYIDQFEITNARYSECEKAGGCDRRSDPNRKSYTRESYYGNMAYDDYPVIYVSWYEAQSYCKWRDARLPTEAEWEKAARGGEKYNTYPWGDATPKCEFGAVNGAKFNDSKDCNHTDTERIGSYGDNGYGLYDMAGNVFEWVDDWYKSYPGGDPSADEYFGETYRVLRGGSWYNDDYYMESSYRYKGDPSGSWNELDWDQRVMYHSWGGELFPNGDEVGFRCARDTSP